MRENRMLRLTWRGLETGSRSKLIRARHARKGGNRRSRDLRITAPVLDPTCTFVREFSPMRPDRGEHSDGKDDTRACLSSGKRDFMVFWPHARADLSEVPLIVPGALFRAKRSSSAGNQL